MQKENGFKQFFIEENIQISLLLKVMLLFCSSSVALITIDTISDEPAFQADLLPRSTKPPLSCLQCYFRNQPFIIVLMASFALYSNTEII